ncbi:MAG: hypothetical protein HYZ28_03710 [Myxococcales bacterium]|nr:hypothetical protein [Myxococcales bacterium]
MSSLVIGSSLKEFFKVLLDEAITRQRVTVAEITECYLVNLLAEFAASEKLFTEELGGRKDHEPLAILYHRAQAQEREQKIRTLRRLGDVSLYKAGFFADALRESVVGTDYYIEMGGIAYGQVASLAPASGFAGAYRELHEKFRALVEVLEEIAARGMVSSGPLGAMQVFESWTRSGSGRLERVLVEAGLLPSKGHLPN